MAQAQGTSVTLSIGQESAYGVTATALEQVSFIPTLILNQAQTQQETNAMSGSRSKTEPYLGNKSAVSKFMVPLDTVNSGTWMKLALGKVATVDDGSGNFTHKFTIHDTSLPSITIQKGHTDTSTYHLGTGFKMNQFSISFGGEEEAKIDLDFLGKEVQLNSTQSVVPTANVQSDPFSPFQVELTGATNVKSGSLSFSNNLDGSQYVIGNGGARGELPLGMVAVSGSITALYENDTLMQNAINNTTASLSIKYVIDATKSIEFVISEVKYEPFGVEVSSPQGIEQVVNFQGFFRSGSNNGSLAVILKNQTASY